jgi:H2-forming N5,N10-methylenetetrahydromethanopterin dehydrogenase-like enzyme
MNFLFSVFLFVVVASASVVPTTPKASTVISAERAAKSWPKPTAEQVDRLAGLISTLTTSDVGWYDTDGDLVVVVVDDGVCVESQDLLLCVKAAAPGEVSRVVGKAPARTSPEALLAEWLVAFSKVSKDFTPFDREGDPTTISGFW